MRLAIESGNKSGWGICATHLKAELDKLPMLPDDILIQPVCNANMGPLYAMEAKHQIGIGFFESVELTKPNIRNLDQFSWVFWGSSWNTQLCKQWGYQNCSTAVQGVDTSVFCPRPQPPHEGFTVFSAGKWEYRKGQDLMAVALRAFMERHADVSASLCWTNQWPQIMETMRQSKYLTIPEAKGGSLQQIEEILRVNGLDMSRVTVHPLVEHWVMADLIREADVGVITSRCEGGTSLPAMEIMACGVPLVAVNATGLRDVLVPRGYFHVDYDIDAETLWADPDVEYIVDALDLAYSDREYAAKVARTGMENVRQFTWQAFAKEIWTKCTEYA